MDRRSSSGCVRSAVCVDWLAWSRMGCFVASAAGGRERRQQGREHAQEDREDNNETTPTSSIFMFIPHSEHTTIAILLSTFMSCPSDLALHRLDRPNALLQQTPQNTPFSTTPTNPHTHSAAHTPRTRSPVHNGYIPEPSSLKSTTTAKTGQRAAPSRATEANSRERRAG